MTDRPARDWPRGMQREVAAEYIGVSPSLLTREAEAGRAPKPVQITPGRMIWLREQLDEYLDRLAGRPSPSPSIDLTSEWDAALGGTGGPAIS